MSSTVRSAAFSSAPSPVTDVPRSLTTTLAPCLASSSAWARPMPCARAGDDRDLAVEECHGGVLSSWVSCAEAVAELELEDLAGGVAGQGVDDLEALGELLGHEALLPAAGHHRVEGDRRGRVGRHDHRAHPLARLRVGQADHGDVGDVGVRKRRSSTSLAEMFSMLRMMMSFTRPVIVTMPSASMRPRSPVRNQPSSSKASASSERVEVALHQLRGLGPDLALLADARPPCPRA